MAFMSSIHGGIDPWAAKEAGINPAEIKDFSISINPSPLPDAIQDVIHNAALYRYPDTDSKALVRALSLAYEAPEDEILVVNGTSQAIFLIAAATLKVGDTAVASQHTYGEYADASKTYGGRVLRFSAAEENGFAPSIDDLVHEITENRPKLFWLCNPNSPTGSWIDATERDRLAKACTACGGTMVIDEAYAKFAPPGLLPEEAHPEVIHLHSMTKDFSIPGLRLGWVRASADVIGKLRRYQPDWSVSAPAQDAGVAVLEHLPYFNESWAKTRSLTKYLIGRLEHIGLKPLPTAANFVSVKIGSDADVKNLSAELWNRLIMVRDCASFGMEGFIRIGTRSKADIDLLLDQIEAFQG